MGFFHFSGLVYQASASHLRMHQGSGEGRRKVKGWIIAVHGVRAKGLGTRIDFPGGGCGRKEKWCCIGIQQQQHVSSAQRMEGSKTYM
jgi:hypothetical protein